MPSQPRVLVYGDSLVCGWSPTNEECVPWVTEELGGHSVGLCGFTTNDLSSGLGDDALHDCFGREGPGLRKAMCMSEKHYDVVVILAGTNDLAVSEEPRAIVRNLAKLCNLALEHGSHVVLLTIPEKRSTMPGCVCAHHRILRNAANAEISKWAAAQGGSVTVVDSAALLPYADGPDWDSDGLHMSPAGYARFGAALAVRLEIKRV